MNIKAIFALVLLSICLPFISSAQWEEVSTGFNAAIYDFHFPHRNVGYAVGSEGTILKTIDCGETWQQLNSPSHYDFYTVWFLDSSTGFVGGDSCLLMKTEDGGVNWRVIDLNSGCSGKIKNLQFIDHNIGFAGGMKTLDGGENWLPGTGNYRYAYFIDADTGYSVSKNTVWKTIDGGQSWTILAKAINPLDSTLSSEFEACFFYNSDKGFIGGWYGPILSRTKDGGSNWEPLTSAAEIYSIHFPTASVGYAAGRGAGNKPVILKTSDSGDTWEMQVLSDSQLYLYNVYFVNSDTGFATGYKAGSIYRTTNGGSISASMSPVVGPKPEVAVYPNPFVRNSLVSIRVKNISGSPVYSLYSIEGKRIPVQFTTPVLLDQVWESTFKTDELSTGTYLLKVYSGNSISRIVLISY